MRIKCPYSDIYLELPGDRTDMKFSCPACRKVHRVTISITTPGEELPPVPKNARDMAREQPPMPKKYATGAYAPVVDIPIDANFVLLDGKVIDQPGVDLSNAAPPPMTREFANRRTEVIDRRPESEHHRAESEATTPKPSPAPNTEASRADSEETSDDDSPPEGQAGILKSDGRRLWTEMQAESIPKRFPGLANKAAGAAVKRRGKGGRVGAVCLLIALLGLAGFLGWQQYLYVSNRSEAADNLERAGDILKSGDVAASAVAARRAEAFLLRSRSLSTPAALWDRLARWSGLFSPLAPAGGGIESAVQAYLERERKFESFRKKLDPANGREMAETLADAVGATNTDPALAEAMQKIVVETTLANLRAEAIRPEGALTAAEEERQNLEPVLSLAWQARFDGDLKVFEAEQHLRLQDEARAEITVIAKTADSGDSGAFDRYLMLVERLREVPGDLQPSLFLSELATEADRPTVAQLS
ncbi:MAG: hypothetical protein FWG74_09760, partial [Planctomycetes bacterium]|nr:hypothetical protein [Planctomycetota bacterium]